VPQKNEKGNTFFRHEQYDDALTYYRDAQLDAPDLPALHFNVGDALYKQGKFDEALREYEQALDAEDGDFKAKVYYNMGNAFFKQNQLSESVEAYKKSLKLVPNDAEAKFNLEFVQSKLQEQEQKQQQDQPAADSGSPLAGWGPVRKWVHPGSGSPDHESGPVPAQPVACSLWIVPLSFCLFQKRELSFQ